MEKVHLTKWKEHTMHITFPYGSGTTYIMACFTQSVTVKLRDVICNTLHARKKTWKIKKLKPVTFRNNRLLRSSYQDVTWKCYFNFFLKNSGREHSDSVLFSNKVLKDTITDVSVLILVRLFSIAPPFLGKIRENELRVLQKNFEDLRFDYDDTY